MDRIEGVLALEGVVTIVQSVVYNEGQRIVGSTGCPENIRPVQSPEREAELLLLLFFNPNCNRTSARLFKNCP